MPVRQTNFGWEEVFLDKNTRIFVDPTGSFEGCIEQFDDGSVLVHFDKEAIESQVIGFDHRIEPIEGSDGDQELSAAVIFCESVAAALKSRNEGEPSQEVFTDEATSKDFYMAMLSYTQNKN